MSGTRMAAARDEPDGGSPSARHDGATAESVLVVLPVVMALASLVRGESRLGESVERRERALVAVGSSQR